MFDRILLTLFVVLNSCLGFAQKTPGYKYYSFPNAQANEVIKGIWKDTTGYIWLATDLGVLSYNGQETTTHTQGLSSLYTKKFAELGDHELVVINDSGVQSILRDRDSIRISHTIYKGTNLQGSIFYPKAVFVDSKGILWVGESNSIVRFDESGENRFVFGNNYNYHRSFSFTEDAFGAIWVVSYSGQFLVWNDQTKAFDPVDVDIPLKEYTSITAVKGDNLVIGGNDGIAILKVDSDKNITKIASHTEVTDISTLKLVKDLVVVGTWDKGLYYFYYDDPASTLKRFEGIEFNDIVDLYYDELSDEIWIAGSENIALLKKTPFSAFGETGKYRIESFMYDEKRNLYLTTGEELYLQNFKTNEKELIQLAEDYFFTSIYLDQDELWIGDHLGRVFKYFVPSKRFELIYDAGMDFNVVNQINKIGEEVWVTNSISSIVRIDKEGLVSQIEGKVANVIRNAPNGDIYIAGSGQQNILSKYNRAEQTFVPLAIDFDYPISPNIRIEDMTFSDERIFLASNEGVLEIQNVDGNYTSASKVPFAKDPSSYACRAVIYAEGNLWIGTNDGVFFWSENQSVHFTTASGLPSRLIRQRGFYSDGKELTVATAKGMARLNLASVKPKSTPRPIIENVIVGDKSAFTEKDLMNIPYQSNLEVSFRCFTYPGYEIQYKTRILGLSDDWNLPSSNQIISLFGIPRGEYTIEVMAKSVGQLWSAPVALQFRVLNPWYMKWWAYLLFCLFSVLIVTLSIRIYHYNLINQKKKLQKLVAEGTREIEKQKNEIIEQKNHIIEQKQELIEKNETVFNAKAALTDADLKYLQLKETQLEDQVEYRNKQITTHTLNIIQKNETLLHLKSRLEKVVKDADKTTNAEIRKTIRFIDESFKQDKDWEDFKLYFEQIYTGFYAKLKIKCPELTSHDLRHCALIRLNLSIQECASILGISPESVKVSRTRIRNKIKTDSGKGLSEFILSL